MGADSTHNLTVVWKQQGLDQVTSSMNNFSKTSQTTAKAQDALGNAMDSTAKSATKTSQEFTKTGKAAQTTGKQTQTLGQAFKSSSLMIAAFASSLVNTYQSIDSLMDQSMKLQRMRATLDKQTTQLQIAEANLKKKYDEGKISGEAYRLQSEKLSSQREILRVKEEQYADAVQDNKVAWLSMATSVIPTVITGFSSLSSIVGALKGTFDSTATSTGALTTAKQALGTAVGAVTTAFTPFSTAVKNLLPDLTTTTDTLGTANSNNTVVGNMGALNTAFLDTEKSGNTFVNTFKSIGTAIKTFFTNIKDNMGNATGIIDKLKAGFSTFFSQIGSGFKGFGSLLKEAGTAVIGFGKALLGAIVANPILLAIAAISAAVLALITNFGGFRDMMNGVGVALGNAIPPLKGFLSWIGEGANAALDAAANFLGFDTSVKKSGDNAVATAKKYGTMVAALEQVFRVQSAIDFQRAEEQVKKMQQEIAKLGTEGYTAWKRLDSVFLNFSNSVTNQSPKVAELFRQLADAMKGGQTGHADYAAMAVKVKAILDELSKTLLGEVVAAEKVIAKQAGMAVEFDNTAKTISNVRKTINDYFTGLKTGETQYQDFALAVVSGNDEIIESMGLSDEEMKSYLERFSKDFPEGARIVEVNGKKIVVSIKDIQDQGAEMTKEIESMVDTIVKGVGDHIPPTFQEAQSAIAKMRTETAYMAEVHKAAASGVINDDNRLAQVINQLSTKYWPSLGKSATDVLTDIQTETQNQTKEQEKANKKTDETIQKIQNLAQTRQQEIQTMKAETAQAQVLIKQLGIQNDVQGMTGKGLLQLIQNYDDMSNSLGIAADNVGLWWSELQKAQKIEEDERQVLLDFAEAHKVTIPDAIKQGSIEGIKAFIEETLKIGPAAKKAKEELLKQFDEIKNGVQSLAEKQVSDLEKAFGESFKAGKKAVKELGYEIDSLASKKAMVNVGINSEEAEDGIVSLREMMVNTINGAQGDLENIDFRGPAMAWRQEMLEEFDKAPAEVQAVFDKIISFADQYGGQGGTQYAAALIAAISAATGKGIPEITKMFDQITGAGTAELQAKANEFFKSTQTGITNPVISGLQGLSTGMSGVVNQSQAGAINAIFAGKGEFQSAGADLAESAASGFESGGHLFATAGEKAKYELMKMFDTAGAEAYAKSHEIAVQSGQGIASGAGEVASGAQTGINAPIQGQIGAIPSEAQTALAPIEGVFSQAFMTASTTASTQLNILLAGVHATADATNQAFSTMSTSVATYSKSMATNIAGFATSSQTSFGTVATSTKTVHTALSSMSSSVKTYSSSMSTAISGFATKASTSFKTVGTAATTAGSNIKTMGSNVTSAMSSMQSKVSSFASAFSSSMKKVKSDADSAKKSVDALKKSIDSLKNKSITIHVGLSGPGVNYIRHGGSGLNFPSESGISYAAGGKSWIQKTPKKIGNTHVSEAFPEIITAIPLDPREKNSPFNKLKDLDLNIPVPLVTATPQISGGGGSNGQPIKVSGNITNTIILPDGKVLATEVKRYLLEGFSGIT